MPNQFQRQVEILLGDQMNRWSYLEYQNRGQASVEVSRQLDSLIINEFRLLLGAMEVKVSAVRRGIIKLTASGVRFKTEEELARERAEAGGIDE